MTTTGSPTLSSSVGRAPAIRRRTGYPILGIVCAVLVTAAAALYAASSRSAKAAPDTWCTDKSTMDILGDSASTGTGVIDPNNSWVTKLRSARPGTLVNNYAHDGAKASDFLPGGRWPVTSNALDAIAAGQPSLVLIELGGNEYFGDLDPASYQANLQRLSNAIHSVSPRSTLVYETIWQFDTRGSANPRHVWDEYAKAMLAVALMHGARWIDLRPFFPPHYDNDINTGLLNADEIHPTDAGNAVEFAAILTMLDRC